MSGRGYVRLATADLLADGHFGFELAWRSLSHLARERPIAVLTPDGPTFWCRPGFAELLCLVRDLDLIVKWPWAVSDVLLAASSSDDAGAFHLESALRSAEEFVAEQASEDLLKELSIRSDRLGPAWITTCAHLSRSPAALSSSVDFVQRYRVTESSLATAHAAFGAKEYSSGYANLCSAIESTRSVAPVFRPTLDWTIASLFQALQFTERVSLVPRFLDSLVRPEPGHDTAEAPFFQSIERLLSALFGYPRSSFLAVQVQPTSEPMGPKGTPQAYQIHFARR